MKPSFHLVLLAIGLPSLSLAFPQDATIPLEISPTANLADSNAGPLDPICIQPRGATGVTALPKLSECMGAMRKMARRAQQVPPIKTSFASGKCEITVLATGGMGEVAADDLWWAAMQVAIGCTVNVGMSNKPGRTAGSISTGRDNKVMLTMKKPDGVREDDEGTEVA